ncbi:hypothetical protein BC829DRAFT_412770 [Chytridium lagenaria]|nr:hypothetical protein BC829DRAFT_412770 [Chytridium lagenaria]
MVASFITPFLIGTLAASSVTASSFSLAVSSDSPTSITLVKNLESRQSPSSLPPTVPKIPACDEIASKSSRPPIPLSDPDARVLAQAYTEFSKGTCSTACTQASVGFAPEVEKLCPRDYLYEVGFQQGANVTYLASDRTKDIEKVGICLKSADGGNCAAILMPNLLKSVNKDRSIDANKYKYAVCSECMWKWVNTNSTPIDFNGKKMDASEVNRVCGEGFLKGTVPAPMSNGAMAAAGASVTAFFAVIFVAVSMF